jgi:hypothetical protein
MTGNPMDAPFDSPWAAEENLILYRFIAGE